MPTSLQEQPGVASDAAHWDLGHFRLWQSTVPEIILYARRELVLAREQGQRYRASVIQMRKWVGGRYEVTGGSAVLGVFGVDDAREFDTEWTRAVLNRGYTASQHPRFLPLPVRDIRVTAMLNASGATESELPDTDNDSTTLVFKLSAVAARDWAGAILDRTRVSGSIRLSYAYPQMMPAAKATVTVHGASVYARLQAMLSSADDGTIYGRFDDLGAAWTSLVREGAIVLSLLNVAPDESARSRAELLDHLSEQAREQFFDILFVRYLPAGHDSGTFYALRWRSAAEVSNPTLTIAVEGWTWLTASLETEIAQLLRALDDSYLHAAYESVSVPVVVVVAAEPTVSNVAVSLDFGSIHAPEAPLFGATGGMRQFLLTTERPEQVRITCRTRVSFSPNNWPVLETTETASLAADGYTLVIRPASWIRRHTLYMYVRRGAHLLAPTEAAPDDYLTVTATCSAPYLARPLRSAVRITPQAPIEFTYPVPPGARPERATLGVIGMVEGQLVRAADLDLNEDEQAVYLLVDGTRVDLVGRSAVIGESDALAERLRSANAHPVFGDGVAPQAEDDEDIDVRIDSLPLIPQPTAVSCWAASLAMLVSVRELASTTPQDIAAEAGMDVDTGYGWGEIQHAVAAWNLVEEGPRSAMPDEWARLLDEWGAIWVVETGAPYHAVVLAGVHGNGQPDETYVTVHNPWPPGVGAVEVKTFLEFDREFGLGAGAGAAMVHVV